MALQEGDLDWLIEAHASVADWKAATDRRMLMTAEASALAERIARALICAYQRGKAAAQ